MITQLKSHIPKIRFKEFSGEWEEKKLGEVSSQISYGLTVRPEFVNEGIPLISAREIKNGFIDFSSCPKISKNSFSKLSKKSVGNKGDIFLSKTGSIGFVAYVDTDKTFAITQNIANIKVNKNNYNHKYIIHQLRTYKFYKSAISKVNQSTIMDLQLQDIKKLNLFFPSLPEQQKIASFLSLVDEKIEKIKEKKKNLLEYKKGVIQKIFSQEIRFKDQNGEEFGEWEEKKFNEVLESISTKNYQIYNSEILENGDFKVVDQGQNKISGYSNNEKKLYKNGPVIIFGDHTTVLKYIDFNFVIGADGTKILKNKIGNLNYLYYFLDFNKIKPEGYKRHFSILKELKILFPTLKEQEKIADFLSGIDEKIEKVSDELGKMEEFKKGLLQGMFV